MNKTICKAAIVFLILLTSLSMKSQVPNGGFELWSEEPITDMLMPDEWTIIAIPEFVVPVTSSATSHSGTLAARGEVVSTGLPMPDLTPILMSIPPESEDDYGFAVTGKYAELTGFYQFFPVGGDLFHVMAAMIHDTIGIASGCVSYPDTASTYTPFSIPIIYFSDLSPEFCMITITICASPDSTEIHAGSYFLVDDLVLGGAVSVNDMEATSGFPGALILKQNYPNPFNSQTRISYELQHDGAVQLSIFDSSGRLIRNLVEGHESAGIKSVIWDGKDAKGYPVANGIYLYRLQTPYGSVSRKMGLYK